MKARSVWVRHLRYAYPPHRIELEMNDQTRILAIDDEEVIIESIARLLTAEGLNVDTSLNADEALLKISKHRYHLIITDLMMPGMDGFQLLFKLNEQIIEIPVIVTTGYSTMENAVKSLYEGAIDFLPKPFTVDELLSCVHRGLNYGKIVGLYSKNEQSDKINYVNCPVDYYRLGYNSWASIQNDGAIRIGVTDLFLKTIQTINRIELRPIDFEVIQGNACAQIETQANLIHNILSPVSGRIININNNIKEQQNIVEKDPYFEGWFYTIIPSDLEYELKHLISCSSDR